MQLEVGTIMDGRVTGITKFGAFVSVPGGKSGLVHISEVDNSYVSDVSEFLSVGQEVRVKLIAVTEDGRLNFSIKKAQEPPRRENAKQARPAAPELRQDDARMDFYTPQKSDDANFEDKLKHFMQEADSRMSGNRLFEQPRRGRRRK